MKPFRFTPILKSLIWGGDKIAPYKGIETTQANIGESWELSGVAGDESVVAEGEYAGYTLPQLIAELKERLVGKSVYERFGTEFPLLVKFIDARADLSIQVHPDDALAQMRHGKHGKTEMWYVVGADRGAHLKAGFSQKITPEEYERRVADNTLTDVLCDYAVQPGDLFFLPAGRVHAICAGSFVAEIQQTSDVTYRIYDYGRLGADGKPRQLHIPQALDVTLREPPKAQDFHGHLAQCDYFTVDAVEGGFEDVCDETSFTSLLVLEGKGTLTETATGESLSIRKGQSLFLPAGTGAYAVTGTDLKCLRTRV